MRKLSKNIFPYVLRVREAPKNLSFLDKRDKKLFKPTTTRASIRARSGSSSVLFQRNHLVLKTFRAPENAFRPRHLSPLGQRFSIHLDDVHRKIDHPRIGDRRPHPIGIHQRIESEDSFLIQSAADIDLNVSKSS